MMTDTDSIGQTPSSLERYLVLTGNFQTTVGISSPPGDYFLAPRAHGALRRRPSDWDGSRSFCTAVLL